VPFVLGIAGIVVVAAACARGPAAEPRGGTRRRVAVLLFAVLSAIYAVIFVGLFFGLEGRHALGPIEIRLFSVARPLVVAAVAGIALFALSPRARRIALCAWRSPVVFASCATFLAFWLSLGPVPRVFGDPLRDASLYRWLYDYAPGFSGLRVPARYAMIVMFFLSIAAACGARVLATGRQWLISLFTAAFLIESTVIPMPLNGTAVAIGHLDPPTTVPTSPTPLTQAIDALPRDAILLELPFGDISWEIQYLYHSTFHWRRMVNGYSGDVPQRYVRTRDALYLLPEEGGERAWQVINQSGATHVVVHERAFGGPRSETMRRWLESRGARLVAHADSGWIYDIRRTAGSG
jgi:hypothetical protein